MSVCENIEEKYAVVHYKKQSVKYVSTKKCILMHLSEKSSKYQVLHALCVRTFYEGKGMTFFTLMKTQCQTLGIFFKHLAYLRKKVKKKMSSHMQSID